MRHRKQKLQLNRFTSWRSATLASLAKSLLKYQSIKTTKAKACAVKPLVERLISLAKQNSLAAKRQANKILNDHKLVSLLFNDIGQRFINKTGGYLRILNLGFRRGDNAQLVILELTEIKKKEFKSKKKEKKEENAPGGTKEHPLEEPRPQEKKIIKPPKRFLGGIRNIFKKERDSL